MLTLSSVQLSALHGREWNGTRNRSDAVPYFFDQRKTFLDAQAENLFNLNAHASLCSTRRIWASCRTLTGSASKTRAFKAGQLPSRGLAACNVVAVEHHSRHGITFGGTAAVFMNRGMSLTQNR